MASMAQVCDVMTTTGSAPRCARCQDYLTHLMKLFPHPVAPANGLAEAHAHPLIPDLKAVDAILHLVHRHAVTVCTCSARL